MNVLLSVKPEHSEGIMSGEKKYEFRRSIFRRKDIDRVYIYCSSPVRRIVGSFEIEVILGDTPERIWDICHEHSGLSEMDFFRYFSNACMAFAVEIGDLCILARAIDPYAAVNGFRPPQSFYYVGEEFVRKLNRESLYTQESETTDIGGGHDEFR